MRLADFIDANIEPILGEWVTFAQKQAGAVSMDRVALRDHAAEMLRTIAADLRTAQTDSERFLKSQGEAPVAGDLVPETAAASHGIGRAASGFTVTEMMAEFRALRASVLKLWTHADGALSGSEIGDLMRFNEAIDQALAESVAQYTGTVDQSQDMFVAILGHDLRTPLQTVTMATQHVLDAGAFDEHTLPLLGRAQRSAHRMRRMLDDLLDFTRARMGAGVSVAPSPVDLAVVVLDAVDEMRTVSPQQVFEVTVAPQLHGHWDGARMSQVLSNLLANAVAYGDVTTPVYVTARGESDHVLLAVRNRGPVIGAAELPGLFSPFKRLRRGAPEAPSHHLGLGLYIVDQIVQAHGGHMRVTSTLAEGTCFSAFLPRTSTTALRS